MNEDIENQLRRAMRPVEPPAGFTERVMRALPEPAPRLAPVVALRPAPRPRLWRQLSAPAALAASLLVAVLLGRYVGTEQAEREQRAGLEARRELMEALRVTSQKLDLAYQAVKRPPPEPAAPQENRT